jgi:hypothetical protein
MKILSAVAVCLVILTGCGQEEKSFTEKTCPEIYTNTSDVLCYGDDYWYMAPDSK